MNSETGDRMERVVEPELMDGVEQAEAYAVADFAQVNTRFVELFREHFPAFQRGTVVDLGCGPADIAIRLATALPALHIVAVDGSRAMLMHARRAVASAGIGGRVELLEGIVPGDWHVGRVFDAAVSNSLLHHLHEPAVLWSTVVQITHSGAPLLVVDLMRPATPQAARDLVERYAANERPILKTDFYNSLRAAFTLDEVRAQLRVAGLDTGVTVAAISDRHLAVWGTRR